MATLEILQYPDERLRTVAASVEQVDDALRQVIDNMFETMYSAQGVGLAATQVDVHKRLFIADCSENKDQPLVFINPKITAREGLFENEEGCLSFPNVYAKVERAGEVTVQALDRDGNEFAMEVDGLLAICVQHEMDHLDGKLFVDYLSPLKRDRIRKKLEKEAKLAAKYA